MMDTLKTILAIVGPALGLGGVIYGAGKDSERQEVRVTLDKHIEVEKVKHDHLTKTVERVEADVKAIRKAVAPDAP